MDSLIKKFEALVKYICAISLTIMVLLIFVNTVMRYCISSSIVAAEELSRFFFVWATFMAVIPVWRSKGHIAVSAITDKIHGQLKRWWIFLFDFLSVFALGALTYGSYVYILRNSYYIQITGISYGFIILPVMLSAIACLIMTISDMIKLFLGKEITHALTAQEEAEMTIKGMESEESGTTGTEKQDRGE